VRENFSVLQEIMDDDDFITSDKFLARAGFGYKYQKRDFLFKPGRWRSRLTFPLWMHPLKYLGQTLVVGHSDFSTGTREIQMLQGLGIRRIYGSNTLNWKNFSHSVPLGLTNDCDDSPIHRIFGNTKHLKIANQSSSPIQDYDATIYINFTASNNSTVRNRLLSIVKDNKFVKYSHFEISDSSRISYLADLRNYSLVPCPEGNGIDTHRLWETLYMGGTPVITKSRFLPLVIQDLPVIQLNSWKELNESALMEERWYEAQKKSDKFGQLRASFWIRKFKGEK
jgi:hypothetical protein